MLPDSCLVYAFHIHRIPEYFESAALCLHGWVYSYRPDILLHNMEHDHHLTESFEHSQVENPCTILQEQNVQKAHGKGAGTPKEDL